MFVVLSVVGLGILPPQEISEEGLLFVAQQEGFRSTVYEDQGGHCTIGYGHLLCPGERCRGHAPEFERGISRGRALELLKEDLDTAQRAVRWYVKVDLESYEFDALVSLCFSIGAGAFQGSTLLRKLNEGKYDEVPDQMKRWVYVTVGGKKVVSKGLERRRRREVAMFKGW